MRNDAYHPHYPSIDGDYFERLMDGAHRVANPYRWMLKTYTDAEEQAVYDLWQARVEKLKKTHA